MAYYLDYTANGNTLYVTVPEISLVAGDVIEMAVKDFTGRDGASRYFWDSSTSTSSLRPFCFVRSGGGQIDSNDTNLADVEVDGTPSEFVFFPTDGEKHTIRSEVEGNCTITHIGARFTNAQIWNAKVVDFKIFRGGSLIHHYDPSASNGTGATLIDTVGGNDGTIVNAPIDNSQWVFYESISPQVFNSQATSSSTTLDYTVPSVTDGRLVVMVGKEDVGNNGPITGVTYGAAALTLDAEANSVVGSNANVMAIYSLALPPTGTDTITIATDNERIGIIAFVLNECGEKTDSDVDVVGGSGATMTTNVTTVGSNNIVVSCTNNSTTSTTTDPTGTTPIASVVAAATVRFQGFYEGVADAGPVSTTSAFFPARSAMATVAYAPIVSGGGGDNIITQDLSDPQSLSNISLTQSYNVSPQDLLNTQSLENLTLFQNYILSVNNLIHQSFIEGAGLFQSTGLVLDNHSQDNLMDSPQLVQKHLLSLNNTATPTQIDSPSLLSRGELSSDGISSDITIDPSTLIQTSVLSIEKVSNQISLGSVSLVLAGVLSIDKLLNNSGLDSPEIIQKSILNIQDLSNNNILENTSLIVDFLLDVINTSSNQSLDDSLVTEQTSTLNLFDLSNQNIIDNSELLQNSVLVVDEISQTTRLGFIVFGTIPELESYLITFSKDTSTEAVYDVDIITIKFGD